jgi:hypothetical protein
MKSLADGRRHRKHTLVTEACSIKSSRPAANAMATFPQYPAQEIGHLFPEPRSADFQSAVSQSFQPACSVLEERLSKREGRGEGKRPFHPGGMRDNSLMFHHPERMESISPGLRGTSYPGFAAPDAHYPERVASKRLALPGGCARMHPLPGVVKSISQFEIVGASADTCGYQSSS